MSSLTSPRCSPLLLKNLHSTISIGKYGSFLINHIIGRPFYLTFEILDKEPGARQSLLRIVPPAELYANINDDEIPTPQDFEDGKSISIQDGVEYEVVGQDGEVVLRTNRNIIDDSTTQSMTMEEIEKLKAEGTGSGKDLIAKIIESHSGLDQKTAFALAKYTLRKAKKYLKRFTLLPMDVSLLARWIMAEKEPMKIMEIREETMALIASWSNVHFTVPHQVQQTEEGIHSAKRGRWLVVDDTGGLLVASIAERLGLLFANEHIQDFALPIPFQIAEGFSKVDTGSGNQNHAEAFITVGNHSHVDHKSIILADTNTITLIHANAQPNLSLLKYFNFDESNPSTAHPLHSHLKTISWLQLIAPEDDNGYDEPEVVSDEILRTWKSGKRGNYYRKRRRWERIKSTVDETRGGDFDGLIIASTMSLPTILHHTIPLLRGAAQVVIYSPTIESLTQLSDFYSTARRTAFVSTMLDPSTLPTEDFPLNPTLLLAPTIQTARCKSWQVLPGRTHPLMTGRGGSEGYIFTATRVLPAEGKIEARGKNKRRKLDGGQDIRTSQAQEMIETPEGHR